MASNSDKSKSKKGSPKLKPFTSSDAMTEAFRTRFPPVGNKSVPVPDEEEKDLSPNFGAGPVEDE